MTGESSQGTRYLIMGAILALVLILTGLGLGYLVANPAREPSVVVLPTRIEPTLPPVPTVPTLTATPEGQATPAPALETPLAGEPIFDTATPLPTLPPDEIVRFRTQIDSVLAYAGPSDQVGVVGQLTRDQEVLVAGRSADGVWWLVCCVSATPAWVKLENGNLLLISGDIGTVDVIQ